MKERTKTTREYSEEELREIGRRWLARLQAERRGQDQAGQSR